MERANVEKILLMVKEGKITIDEALNLIDAVNEKESVNAEKEKKNERFNNAKESVKKGFVKAGEVISDIATKVNNVGTKCVENIREEFAKNKDDEIIVEEVKDVKEEE